MMVCMSAGERGRLPALDGVRGIAILLVLVGHTEYRLAPLAAAGVALFFALSGYLITGLLFAERERDGQLNLRRFYARRLTRLAPPLFVMLIVMGTLLGSGSQLLGPATWTANYAHIFGADLLPFDHTWSLGVEEQFYLVWPGALILLLRRRSPVRTLTAVMCGLTTWWLLLVVTGHVDYAYYALETAGVPILGGCLVALRGPGKPRHAVEPFAALLLFAGVAAAVSGEVTWSVVPVASVPITIALVAAAPGSRWLSWRPLRFCGVASYSIYLWHLPVAWAVNGHITPIGVGMGTVVGLFAYFMVEAPVMRMRRELQAVSVSPRLATDEAEVLGGEAVA